MSGEPRSRAWVALGSNLGDRAAALTGACLALSAHRAIEILAGTLPEETSPLDQLPQPAYLNQMLLVATSLSPAELLDLCHELERAAGREPGLKWASRILDLDVVRFGDVLCDAPGLTLPHPGLRDREFWIREMAVLEAHE